MKEPARFTERVSEYPGGSTWWLFLEVRGAPPHWLLSLTPSGAALRGGLFGWGRGR